MSVNVNRQFKSELNNFTDKNVIVTTNTGQEISGVLIGMNTDDFSLILGEAEIEGRMHHRIFVSGASISQIVLGEAPFDIQGLKAELERVFKKSGVRYFADSRTIMVMDRFRVTEDGVEGKGPVADRIERIWQNYNEQQEKAGKATAAAKEKKLKKTKTQKKDKKPEKERTVMERED